MMRTHIPRCEGYCALRVGATQQSLEPSARRRCRLRCSQAPASKAASTCARRSRACSRNPAEVMPASTSTNISGPTCSNKRCAPCTRRVIVAVDLHTHHRMAATLGQQDRAHLRIGPGSILIAAAPKGLGVSFRIRGVKDGAIDAHEPIATKEGDFSLLEGWAIT